MSLILNDRTKQKKRRLDLIIKTNQYFSLHTQFKFIAFIPPNSSKSDVNIDDVGEEVRFRPPNGFTDSREFSEAECDRDVALDLEVQQCLANEAGNGKFQQNELTSLLSR